jgi:hypothetical protein
MSLVRSRFDELYDAVTSSIEDTKQELHDALNAKDYSEIANFKPYEVYEPTLRAEEHLEDYFNAVVLSDRQSHPDYNRYMNVTIEVNDLGRYLDEDFMMRFGQLKLRLAGADLVGINDDDMIGAVIQPASILSPTGRTRELHGKQFHLPASQQVQPETSLLSMINVPNALLLFLVGCAVRQLWLCATRPLYHNGRAAQNSIFSLFSRKKEKDDGPERDDLLERARFT